MTIPDFIYLTILLIILAEVSYLTVRTPKHIALRRQSKSILLDTSVLIDGRIVTVAQTGFISGTLIIPKSVLGELQFLADTGDHDKRSRARFGLDAVSELQALQKVDVKILQDSSKADEGVDERLLTLAKKYGAAICTIDYNLNKVALVEGISVLNVNELAQSVRMAYLPGEKMQLELVQKGQDAHQAVGYLPDGTMVVVEHANGSVGQTIEVEIIRSLQTAAGRMMFARRMSSHVTLPKSSARGGGSSNRTRKDTNDAGDGKKERFDRPVRQQANPPKPRNNRERSLNNKSGQNQRRHPSDIESNLIDLVEQSENDVRGTYRN